MESLASSEWQFSRRQGQIFKYGTAGAAGLYLLYRVYKSDSLAALIELRERVLNAMESSSKSFITASECSNLIIQDLQQFLNSDTDKVPQSLQQLAKLAKSKEVSQATASLAGAAAKGAFGALQVAKNPSNTEAGGGTDIFDRVLTLLTSTRGMSLVQLAVSVACRSAVQTYCEHTQLASNSRTSSLWEQIIEGGSTAQGEKLYSACVGAFVREGTKVWMGSLEGVSGWEDFLSSLCKPERHAAVDRLTRSFVNELVVSYLRRTRRDARQDGRSRLAQAKLPSDQSLAQAMPMPFKEASGIPPMGKVENKERLDSLSGAKSPEWTAALVEAAKHPEIRSLMLSVAKTATSEGVRTSIFATRDLLLGPPRSMSYTVLPHQTGGQLVGMDVNGLQLSTRSLGTLLLFIFMPIIIFLAGRRAALA